MSYRFFAAFFGLCLIPNAVLAQAERPRPYPVIPIPAYQQAVERGSRTTSGERGPEYWINGASYTLRAVLSPETATLRGQAAATYFNRSPDALDRVYVHLRQNLHAPGAVRNRPQEITGGVHLGELRVEGTSLVERRGGVGYSVDGTVMEVRLPVAIPPGGSMEFEFAWSFEIPAKGAQRMGQDGEVFFVGY